MSESGMSKNASAGVAVGGAITVLLFVVAISITSDD
jgi:hypothetical protein